MSRPTNFVLRIIAEVRAEEERNRPKLPKSRICPFTADQPWYMQMNCSTCIGKVCARFERFGLNDEGEPLPYVERPQCGAITRQLFACANRIVPGKTRCRFHGGLSTGPKTIEGKARIAAAQRLRWAKWRVTNKPPEA
ncbi:MAG: HGGxSTG domain-containing protein [Albidovulum sp.]|uniref:HGGxSTG domain-containing protein n=1 Tax=Albidovulum sp. TaxID=1872424 RepID=UPI003C89393D